MLYVPSFLQLNFLDDQIGAVLPFKDTSSLSRRHPKHPATKKGNLPVQALPDALTGGIGSA